MIDHYTVVHALSYPVPASYIDEKYLYTSSSHTRLQVPVIRYGSTVLRTNLHLRVMLSGEHRASSY